MRWIASEDVLCLYFLATDLQLERVKKDASYIYDEDFIKECNKDLGDNAHIISLNNHSGTRLSVKYIKELMYKYKSVSWWNKQQKKYYEKRRKLCQQ